MLNRNQKRLENRIMYGDEKVGVILPTDLNLDFSQKKIILKSDCVYDLTYYEARLKFIYRYDAEENNNFIQLIPYTVIINPETKKIYTARRLNGDYRLKNTLCVGFGGHINPNDKPNPIITAAKRELGEEIFTRTQNKNLELIGLIRNIFSNTSEHLGIFYKTYYKTAFVREKESFSGQWMSLDEIKNYEYSNLEGWSKIIIDYLYEYDKDYK